MKTISYFHLNFTYARKRLVFNLVAILAITLGLQTSSIATANVAANRKTYLPLIMTLKQPVLLGTYSQEWPGSQAVMDAEYHALDAWAGKRLSITGTFIDMFSDPSINIQLQLETMWDNGYTPFVNLTVVYNSGITAGQIANGYADTALHAVANTYASIVQNTQRMAFIAPLQEMNGSWVPYGLDPYNFKLAYRRIQQIFTDEGVPSDSVRWVFAPNGWSAAGDPILEDYYPGDAYVDVVAFSAYNFGYCSVNTHPAWQTPETAYHEYVDRLVALAPSKPIFIAQTATTAYTKNGRSVAAKNQWLTDAYNFVVAHPAVRAVIYYNRWDAECDWSFYQQGGEQYTGYRQGVANPVFGYVDPATLKNMIFTWP